MRSLLILALLLSACAKKVPLEAIVVPSCLNKIQLRHGAPDINCIDLQEQIDYAQRTYAEATNNPAARTVNLWAIVKFVVMPVAGYKNEGIAYFQDDDGLLVYGRYWPVDFIGRIVNEIRIADPRAAPHEVWHKLDYYFWPGLMCADGSMFRWQAIGGHNNSCDPMLGVRQVYDGPAIGLQAEDAPIMVLGEQVEQ